MTNPRRCRHTVAWCAAGALALAAPAPGAARRRGDGAPSSQRTGPSGGAAQSPPGGSGAAPLTPDSASVSDRAAASPKTLTIKPFAPPAKRGKPDHSDYSDYTYGADGPGSRADAVYGTNWQSRAAGYTWGASPR